MTVADAASWGESIAQRVQAALIAADGLWVPRDVLMSVAEIEDPAQFHYVIYRLRHHKHVNIESDRDRRGPRGTHSRYRLLPRFARTP